MNQSGNICGSSNTCNIIVSYVIPSLGLVFTNFMWFSIFNTVSKSFCKRKLQKTNPLMFSAMTFYTFSWMLFGIITNNIFLYYSHVFGFLLSIYYSGQSFITGVLENLKLVQERLNNLLNTFKISTLINILIIIFSLHGFILLKGEIDRKKAVCGVISGISLILLYLCPLLIINADTEEIGSQGNFKKFFSVTFFNSTLWITYGILLKESFIIYPNVIGILISPIPLLISILTHKEVAARRSDLNDEFIPRQNNSASSNFSEQKTKTSENTYSQVLFEINLK